MGFSEVYRSLQQLFPQIDSRMLRAVATEHSKDVNGAVETVLTEAIPFFNERLKPNTPFTGGEVLRERYRPGAHLIGRESIGESSSGDNLQPADGSIMNSMGSTEDQKRCNITAEGEESFHHADDRHKEPIYDAYDRHHEGECADIDRDNVNTFKIEVPVVLETNESITTSGECTLNVIPDDIPCQTWETLQVVNVETSENLNVIPDDIPCQTWEALQVETSENLNPFQERGEYVDLGTRLSTSLEKENEHKKLLADASHSVASSASVAVKQSMVMSSERSAQLVVLIDKDGSDTKDLDANLLNETATQIRCRSDVTGTEDANLNDSMSQASEAHLMEEIKQSIDDARNSKKMLLSTMQSVVSLMREVELKEEAAKQAKVKASMAGSDVLAKVEELKQKILQTMELAREVRGEKSILAQELRKLQSRVLSLAEDRDKSLADLDEMHHAVEVRLAEAENEIKSAKQHKVLMKKAATETLIDEELIMEKVVQEGKMLKHQAKENVKLQEFLMDRGQIVDKLKGEIAVICQDVRLKDNLDVHIPFSKSLLSSQTSRMLASSSTRSVSEKLGYIVKATKDVSDGPEEGWEVLDSNETSFGCAGEIAVICQDVRLKDNLDVHIPFSKSLLSSQTSRMLASSSTRSVSEKLGYIVKATKDVSDGPEEGWEVLDSNETSFGCAGEIAVICQDVRLKDNLDVHIPFSKSLLSSQTSRMLASSSTRSVSEKLGYIVKATKDVSDGPEEGWEVLDSNETSFG